MHRLLLLPVRLGLMSGWKEIRAVSTNLRRICFGRRRTGEQPSAER
jgi:hypothetical protein